MRDAPLLAGLAVIVALLFGLSLLTGPAGLGWGDSLRALLGQGAEAMVLVMREVRMPRALLGLAVGAGLGMAGAAMQGWLRNPLAEPGLIGTSSTAALGAVIALQSGLAAALPPTLPVFALAGAALAVVLVVALAGPRGETVTIILAGTAITTLGAAMTSLVLNLSPNPFAASEIVFWIMGALTDRSFTHVAIALPLIAIGGSLLLLTGRGLDALTLGEDAAETMGISLRRLRGLLILGSACIIGGSTAVVGAIGFVGLVVPHVLRPLVGGVPSRLLPASALGGAAMLLAADIAVRLIAPDRDIKLGVLTAIVGAPFFLHLILKMRRGLA
jgi:iron complex transport system permease protein